MIIGAWTFHERLFARRIAEGPTATAIDHRRDLLRYANQAVLNQSLGWVQHTVGSDVSKTLLALDCECVHNQAAQPWSSSRWLT